MSEVRLPDSGLLAALQGLLLPLTGALAVISSPRRLVYDAFYSISIPLDFHAVTLSIADFLVLALLAVTLLRFSTERAYRLHLLETSRSVFRRFGGMLWLILAGWLMLSGAWAAERGLWLGTTFQYLAVLALMLITADWVRTHGMGILWALLLGGALQSGVALLQILNQNPLGLGVFGEVPRPEYDPTTFFRASGLSMHPNYLGGYLMLCLFAAALLSYTVYQGHKRILEVRLPAALGLLCALGLISTLSRSAYLATVIGLLPLALVGLVSLRGRARRIALGVGAAAMVAAAVIVLLVVRGDFATRFLQGREFFLDDTLRVIQGAPLLGVGAGNLMHAVSLSVGDPGVPILPVHNVYVYLWAEVGIIGMLIFIAACGGLLFRLRLRHGAAVFTLGCGMLSLCVVMLFDNYAWAVQPHRVITFWFFGVFYGVLLASWQKKSSSPASSQP